MYGKGSIKECKEEVRWNLRRGGAGRNVWSGAGRIVRKGGTGNNVRRGRKESKERGSNKECQKRGSR
jgi:hypothetical protein